MVLENTKIFGVGLKSERCQNDILKIDRSIAKVFIIVGGIYLDFLVLSWSYCLGGWEYKENSSNMVKKEDILRSEL